MVSHFATSSDTWCVALLGRYIYLFVLYIYWALAKTFGLIKSWCSWFPYALIVLILLSNIIFTWYLCLRISPFSFCIYMDYDLENPSPTSHNNVSMADLLEGVCGLFECQDWKDDIQAGSSLSTWSATTCNFWQMCMFFAALFNSLLLINLLFFYIILFPCTLLVEHDIFFLSSVPP